MRLLFGWPKKLVNVGTTENNKAVAVWEWIRVNINEDFFIINKRIVVVILVVTFAICRTVRFVVVVGLNIFAYVLFIRRIRWLAHTEVSNTRLDVQETAPMPFASQLPH